MQLSLDNTDAKYVIRGYDDRIIRINSDDYSHSLIVSANQLIENWAPPNIDDLIADHLIEPLSLKPTILLIGSGSKLKFPDQSTLASAYQKNIGVEIMDTPAACRTFNLLCSENRNVVACLIID